MAAVASLGAFFRKNSDTILEGSFWGTWCGLNILNWTQARRDYQSAEALPSDTKKADLLWQAKKEYILSSFSLVSGISMVVSFFQEAKFVSMGALGSLIASVGFGGSAVVSSSKLWDSLQELAAGAERLSRANGEKEKAKIAFDGLETLVRVAFYATVAVWGALGAVHALIGGDVLFVAMDTALYLAVLNFGAFLISSQAIPLLKKTI